MKKDYESITKDIVVAEIPAKGTTVIIDSTPPQLAQINSIYIPKYITVSSLSAHMEIKPLASKDTYKVTGNINATINTVCIISLKELSIDITEDIAVEYSYNKDIDEHTDETYLLPETIVNGKIDIYDTVIQTLALSLPENPTHDGVTLEDTDYKGKNKDKDAFTKNPFDVLKNLK